MWLISIPVSQQLGCGIVHCLSKSGPVFAVKGGGLGSMVVLDSFVCSFGGVEPYGRRLGRLCIWKCVYYPHAIHEPISSRVYCPVSLVRHVHSRRTIWFPKNFYYT